MRDIAKRAWACAGVGARAVCVLGALLAGAGAFADEEVLDSKQILQALTGGSSHGTTRGIAAEAAPRVPPPFTAETLPAIRFEYNSARLTGQAERQVDELGAALDMKPLDGLRFAVQGHTDSSGTAAYNRDLSLRRAESVQRRLMTKSRINGSRLTAVGLGEDQPQRGRATTDPSNRRVEIVTLGRWRMSGDSTASRTRHGGRALLIGIDAYTTVKPLEGPVNDVKELLPYVRDVLGFPPDGIRTLLDHEATRDNILAEIRSWLIPTPGPAFLYFSGHGFQQRDRNGDETDGLDETLVPIDVEVEGGAVKGMITDDELAPLWAMRTGKMDVVIDACHSGTLTRGIGAPPNWRLVKSPRLPDGGPLPLGDATRGASRQESPDALGSLAFLDVEATNPHLTLWTAVRADQKALVDGRSFPRLSVFTRHLLSGARDGAADANGDEQVTAQELLAYVRTESNEYCTNNPANCSHTAGLTPQLSIAPESLDEPAFAVRRPAARSRGIASLAKDILVRPTTPAVAGGQAGSGGVQLRLTEGAQLRLGDEVAIEVESDRDGALVLLDIDAAGQMTQVFPNEHSLREGVSPRVKRGERVMIPGGQGGFRFYATPPPGSGRLIAVVAGDDDDTHLRTLTARHKDLAVIPRADAYVVELAGHIRRGDAGSSYGELEYSISDE